MAESSESRRSEAEERETLAPSNPHPQEHLPPENEARTPTHPLRAKGRPLANPEDYRISLRARGGADQQHLAGFDPEYSDIVDYIVRCTHRIWEEKNVGLIYTHYLHSVAVHTPYGTSFGREGVIASTLQMQAAFPDRRLIPDDVIWTGDDQAGFYTSHRITSTGTNLGWGVYGPPTGVETRFRVIADCVVKANRICEEWLVRDELALIHGLGLDVDATVQRLIESGACPPYEPAAAGGIERVAGQTTPEPVPPAAEGPFDAESFVRRSMHDVWNWRMFGRVRDYYAPDFTCHTVDNVDCHGQEETITWYQSLLAAFPDAQMLVDHVQFMGDEAEGYRVSTRWRLVGTHLGYGPYGSPTGRRASIMGISQQHIRDGRYVEEWMLFNPVALMCQLAAPPKRE